jgi:hypothetical protein
MQRSTRRHGTRLTQREKQSIAEEHAKSIPRQEEQLINGAKRESLATEVLGHLKSG